MAKNSFDAIYASVSKLTKSKHSIMRSTVTGKFVATSAHSKQLSKGKASRKPRG
jgi:hypothetical protein